MKKVLILNDIRSVINVGAIFRTADAIGINTIYLTGYTPAPIDRFGRKRNDFAKAALGAEDTVKWEQKADVIELINELREKDFNIVAVEQDEKSVDYKEVGVEGDMAVLMGNETDGVDPKILKEVDVIAEIPMVGKKESLNVSVATGVFLFRLFDR